MINEELKVTIETIVNSYLRDIEDGKTDLNLESYVSLIGLSPEQKDYAESYYKRRIKLWLGIKL